MEWVSFRVPTTHELASRILAVRPSTIHSFSISVLLRNPGTGDFPQPLRIADKWEEQGIIHPTLAHRINVRVDHLDRLIRDIFFGIGYALVGIVFALPATNVKVWRLAAWTVSAIGYAAHIAC